MNKDNKIPPHDIESEEAVVGSLLIGGEDAISLLNPLLEPDEFYSERCMVVYNAILNLYKRNEKINQNTVGNELVYLKQSEIVGGLAYLAHLCSITPTYLDIDSYGLIVHRLSVYRKLITASNNISDLGYNADPDLEGSINKANDILFRLTDRQTNDNFIHIREGIDKIFEQQEVSENNTADRIKTGLTSLDELLGGFYKGDLIILAGRPSMGKSSLALNIARNVAIQKFSVAFFSIEMALNLLLIRLVANESNIPINVATGIIPSDLTEIGERRIMEAIGVLSETNIWIDDSPVEQIMDIRSKLRRLSYKTKIDLVVIDHIGLITSGNRFINRNEEVGYISKQLKTIAREFKVPILVLSQLNRGNESRADKRPQLSDLRESGEIEQNADDVLFIYRDEYYYPTKEAWINENPDKDYPPPAELIVSKNRNGATGTVYLKYEPNLYRFSSIAKEVIV